MTTAMVANKGGHIAELVSLAERIQCDGDPVWITVKNVQTQDLLAGRTCEFVPTVGERDVKAVLKGLRDARRIFKKHNVTRVISTGSAIALAYLPVAAAMGLETHYIECSARVTGPSVSGRILQFVPRVKTWWQYENAPSGFRHLAGIFDPFEVRESPSPPPISRVVVTVGTTTHDFRRLIEPLSKAIPAGVEVLWQTGKSDISGLGIDGRELVPEQELIAAASAADAVVTHAGCGSLLLALESGKVPVFVPRRYSFGEQVDDHQVELATWAQEKDLAITVEADEIDLTHLLSAAGRQVVEVTPKMIDFQNGN